MTGTVSHISNAEREQFKSFQTRKAVCDSYNGGSYLTGWVGRLFAMIALSESDAVDNPNLSQEQKNQMLVETVEMGSRYTGWIGGILGFVVSPFKIMQTLATRELLFSQAQVNQVIADLNALAPALQSYDKTPIAANAPPAVQQFQLRVTELVDSYGNIRFSSSEGSRELIEELQQQPKLFMTAAWIIKYLNEPGEALPCIHAEKYPKNQGKRLFNTIMAVFTANQPAAAV